MAVKSKIKVVKKLSHEDFIRIWNSSSTLEDVIARTGLTRPTIHNRKKLLVGLGVELKLFPGMKMEKSECERLIALSKETLSSV